MFVICDYILSLLTSNKIYSIQISRDTVYIRTSIVPTIIRNVLKYQRGNQKP